MSAIKRNIFELIVKDNLTIPNYQRPYRWVKKNIEDLLSDVSKAIEESKKYGESYKYRIGTVLIHNCISDGKQYIVDGQQRIISISLVCIYLMSSLKLGNLNCDLVNHRFSDNISKLNIKENFKFIQQWFRPQSEDQKSSFLNALKRIIEVIVICVEKESEAFQLFDSQNSRGKALYPHDLLKAYHLREMTSSLSNMEHAVQKWEDEAPSDIKEIFGDFLYPIYNWSRKCKSNIFSSRDIEVFKGVDIKDSYTYALRTFKSSPLFQINESFIAGHDFFAYIEHYIQMLRDIKKELWQNPNFDSIRVILEDKSSGLRYCKTLFYCALLTFYDRFQRFDKIAIVRLFTWAFMIRVDMFHLGYDTINKYAIGEYNRQYSNNLPIFSIIINARKHTDISNLTINCKYHEDNWRELADKLLAINGLD